MNIRCSRQGRHKASHDRTPSARLCGNRRRRSRSYHLGESQLMPDWHGSTSLVPPQPVTGDFETPTVHPTHFVRMGWDSFIWKEGPPRSTRDVQPRNHDQVFSTKAFVPSTTVLPDFSGQRCVRRRVARYLSVQAEHARRYCTRGYRLVPLRLWVRPRFVEA